MRRPIALGVFVLFAACSDNVLPERLAEDAGTSVPSDAATASLDAATPVVDSGLPEHDAGLAAVDAGSGRADAGSGPADAGSGDAAVVPVPDAGTVEFTFSTPAWADGEEVPTAYTCAAPGGFGHSFNPELVWAGAPAQTQGFVMIFDDPDARGFQHWAFYTANPDRLGVAEGTSTTDALPDDIVEVMSQWTGFAGYIPNCPGGAEHTYRWRLWAVDNADFGGVQSIDDLERFVRRNGIQMAQFSGRSDAALMD